MVSTGMQVPCLRDIHFIHACISSAWNSVCMLKKNGCWIG